MYTAKHLPIPTTRINKASCKVIGRKKLNKTLELMKDLRCRTVFRINLIRDTTVHIQEYKVYDAETNKEITDRYRV